MKRLIAASMAASIALPCAAASQERPEPFLLLEVARACATNEQDAILARELELRMPGAFLVRGSVGAVQPDWRITWRPLPTQRCELVFNSSDNSSTMDLGPDASPAEIQLAASRVAWLASISPPRDVVSPEAALIEEPVPVEAPVPEEPVPEEPAPEEPEEPFPELEPEPPAPVPEPAYHPVATKISLLPNAVAYPRTLPERDVPRLSLNLIGGKSHGLEGVEVGLLWNQQTHFARGVQAALGANLVGGDADAVQIALGLNSVGGAHTGTQLAVGLNRAGSVRGIQAAVGANIASGEARAVQLSSGLNYAGHLKGLQVGVLNVAGDADGAQVGLVNVARTSDVSLGIVNVLYGEPLYATAWGTSVGGVVFGLQHGGRFVRYAYLGGLDLGFTAPAGKLGLGIGGHIPMGRFYLDGDALLFWHVPFAGPINRLSLAPQLKASFGWQIARRFAVFGGVSAVGFISGLANATDYIPDRARDRPQPASSSVQTFGWPELHAGVRF